MTRIAARLLRRFKQKPLPGAVFADLQEVHAIGNMRGGLITNKAGRAVLRARYRGRDVKVYEAFSAQHARFISAVSAAMPDVFPEVLELRGAWVIAEWVEGTPVRQSVELRQVEVLRRIHALSLEGLPPAGFCYLQDFIIPRYQRAAAIAGISANGDELFAEAVRVTGTDVVMHPDVSPDNLLQAEDGRIICIDNELLCTGRMPMLDLCNAMRPLPQPVRDRMASIWFKAAVLSEAEISGLAQAWRMRDAGAAFISGDFQRCQAVLDRAGRGAVALLPFDVPLTPELS